MTYLSSHLDISCFFTVVLVVFYLHTYSWYCYSVIFWLQFIMLLLYTRLYARTLSFSYILIRSLLTTLNLHIQILDVLCSCSGVRWARTPHKGLEFHFVDSGILASFLILFLYFSWFLYIRFSLYFNSLFIWYHVWILLYDIAVIKIHYSLDL